MACVRVHQIENNESNKVLLLSDKSRKKNRIAQ